MISKETQEEAWNVVEEESQLKFTDDGDVFTGKLLSFGENGGIPQAHFTGTGKFAGADYFTNAGHDLMRKLVKVPLGSEVRIERTGTLDTGQPTAMMLFAVQYR